MRRGEFVSCDRAVENDDLLGVSIATMIVGLANPSGFVAHARPRRQGDNVLPVVVLAVFPALKFEPDATVDRLSVEEVAKASSIGPPDKRRPRRRPFSSPCERGAMVRIAAGRLTGVFIEKQVALRHGCSPSSV